MDTTLFIVIATYGLAFWYGSELVKSGEMEADRVITVFFSVVIGAMGLGQAAPSWTSFSEARGAAPKVFAVIDSVPSISNLDIGGRVPTEETVGDISLRNVTFFYPSCPENSVIHGIDLEVPAGKTVALVGPSGSGKSTVIGLIERIYDPTPDSVVALDGTDVRELNVRWLRSQIGVVGQMPILFKMTVAENIAFGAGLDVTGDGKNRETISRNVSREQIIEAAKAANAHSFIEKLSEGYDTMIDERGAMLSGGQKQRIAIARALVGNPKILFLDEAASALDAQSESIVQEALERASAGRTTVVVAHHLSTIRNADLIVVLKDGCIVEKGTHDELLAKDDGLYTQMFHLQQATLNESQKTMDSRSSASDADERELEDMQRAFTRAKLRFGMRQPPCSW